ncbi:MAG: RNase adapter RapZ, partial [Actinobacteria bacterium]|nr:RNase adapter RapZ [Actinomycetota bacterium]
PGRPFAGGSGSGGSGHPGRVVFVTGRSGAEYLEELAPALEGLRGRGRRVRVLFLDAPDDVLVRRYEGTRRRHPLDAGGVMASIGEERRLLDAVRQQADVLIDTGELNVNQLRARVMELFSEQDVASMKTSVVSFGYKHGIPRDVDLVFDCRFLPNPYWIEGLRALSGIDEPVRQYVMVQAETGAFLEHLEDLLYLVLPAYAREGKSYLTIAMGCTGGRHRSVVLATELARRLIAHGYSADVFHRDIDR